MFHLKGFLAGQLYRAVPRFLGVLAGVVATFGLMTPLQAQNIGWEGETGVFVTPLAYTAASPAKGLGQPLVAFHYLNGGGVLGDFFEVSGTEGAFGRMEFGYTRPMHTLGGDPNLSALWNNGFNIVHAKVNLVPENAGKNKWVPAISVGFIARTQVRNVDGAMQKKDTTNGDVYVVATKLIPQIKALPVLVNFGVRGTNAELWGMGGNAPGFETKVFASAGFVVKLPKKASAVLGAEMAQQPVHPDLMPTAVIPTTLTYCVRLSPVPETKLNLDFGVAQIAGKIAPGVDLQARARVGLQISYGF